LRVEEIEKVFKIVVDYLTYVLFVTTLAESRKENCCSLLVAEFVRFEAGCGSIGDNIDGLSVSNGCKST
jgi:hypothetical protein